MKSGASINKVKSDALIRLKAKLESEGILLATQADLAPQVLNKVGAE